MNRDIGYWINMRNGGGTGAGYYNYSLMSRVYPMMEAGGGPSPQMPQFGEVAGYSGHFSRGHNPPMVAVTAAAGLLMIAPPRNLVTVAHSYQPDYSQIIAQNQWEVSHLNRDGVRQRIDVANTDGLLYRAIGVQCLAQASASAMLLDDSRLPAKIKPVVLASHVHPLHPEGMKPKNFLSRRERNDLRAGAHAATKRNLARGIKTIWIRDS